MNTFEFHEKAIRYFAPDTIGVYYCLGKLSNGNWKVLYIGRAQGTNVTIRSRLLDHYRDNKWYDVMNFCFYPCRTPQEAIELEKIEIQRHMPKYNQQYNPLY